MTKAWDSVAPDKRQPDNGPGDEMPLKNKALLKLLETEIQKLNGEIGSLNLWITNIKKGDEMTDQERIEELEEILNRIFKAYYDYQIADTNANWKQKQEVDRVITQARKTLGA